MWRWQGSTATRIIARDNLKGWTLIIAGVCLAFGLVFLLPRLGMCQRA